ncbi:MAG: tRNA pseudouridine(55) synthase TruB [Anaerolineales bacterium]
MNALLVVDKPSGPTSHDIVNRVRRWTRVRRVGHAGTLDPLATGVLVVCIGATTRLSEYLLGHDKHYTATLRLGSSTDTYDAAGAVVRTHSMSVSRSELEQALQEFRGHISQRPPPYSAVKTKGVPAYARARRGEHVELQARAIEIKLLELVDFAFPDVTLNIHCSAGTYIRSLAHDLGERLRCGAHLTALRRTAAGSLTLAVAHTVDELEQAFANRRAREVLLPPDAGLTHWPRIVFPPDQEQRLAHGNAVPLEDSVVGMGRAYNSRGQLIAIVEADTTKMQWRPRKVLVSS